MATEMNIMLDDNDTSPFAGSFRGPQSISGEIFQH